jgi:hypothetical protein
MTCPGMPLCIALRRGLALRRKQQRCTHRPRMSGFGVLLK